MSRARILLLLFLLPVAVQAQNVRHLDQRFDPDTPATLDEWNARADELRSHIIVSTGLWPLAERPAPKVTVTGTSDRDGYSVQNLYIETYPGHYLTANLYLPEGGNGPFPAVLTPHGHWDEGRLEDGETGSIPARSINLARQGYVVLAYSMVGYNENQDFFPHRFDDRRYQLWGFGAMAIQLWNSLRAMDYLSALPQVDASRIGMTGASGGGTQTFMLTAIDPRVRAAAPVNMISLIMQGGCVCENAPLLRLHAHNVEIGGLAAPRPLLMVSATGDWTRETPRREFPAMKAIFNLFGVGDRVTNVHLDYPHNYNRASREAMYTFFSRWLKGEERQVREAPYGPVNPEQLLAKLPGKPASTDEVFESWKTDRKSRLNLPADRASLRRYRQVYGSALEHVLETGAAVDAGRLEERPARRTGATDAIVIVHDGTSRASQLADSMQAAGRQVFLFDPGNGDVEPPDSINHWTAYNPTPASRRIASIRLALERVATRPGVKNVDVIALGARGPETLLARAFVPQVRNTTIDLAGFRSEDDRAYLERLFIPSLRMAGDLRTALALTAPENLVLIGATPDLARDAASIYNAAGATEKLVIRK